MGKKLIPSLSDMFEGRASRYALVILISKRAREIVSEYESRERELIENPITLAIKDFKSKRYDFHCIDN
ncbi:MAG: DNA-directed RNA polymerase subunit omega [Candidatus Improbicoccus pseudotrichonymphae]|uniref:DNA-directed RNA polymerase subunit omega n=1 Tax=Candidatus Improbicoccus pseudotrichonymphae TaxID=3033792 RepID=A0AA48HYR2_9FIRM|nr:MAG: DNA-directed RNA polymerase subunit omega [Candidatus Improbicoccus pseudotrichonymphae]